MGWLEVYKKDISKHKDLDTYVNYKIKNKKVFIRLIKKYAENNKRVIEAGAGTGILSTYIASLGYNVTTIDIDKDILKLSKEIAEGYKSVNKPIFQIKSIFKLNYRKNFDVCMSNGVLEHFTDDEIIETLKQQMKIAETVIFGIPTQYFRMSDAMYGDERYLSLDYWRHLIYKANGIVLEEKSMKYFTLRERIFKFNKYFKPDPFRIFVIRQKPL